MNLLTDVQYTFDMFCIQFILGLILFFIINWIGKASISIGYVQMGLVIKDDEAPAYNFIMRVCSPVIYVLIVSAIIYKFKLDRYILNIYLVSVYYLLIRLFVNIITGRGLLLNWWRQITYWICIITLSYLAYRYLIQTKEYLFPDPTTIANELWIIILLFIYQLCNNIRLSNRKTEERKKRYITSKYNKFKQKFGATVNQYESDERIKNIVYSIMISEDFNRPLIVRLVENLTFKISKKKTSLGIMQVQTKTFINDNESIVRAIAIIKQHITDFNNENDSGDQEVIEDKYKVYNIAYRYNSSYSYASEIEEIYNIIDTYDK